MHIENSCSVLVYLAKLYCITYSLQHPVEDNYKSCTEKDREECYSTQSAKVRVMNVKSLQGEQTNSLAMLAVM